MAVRRVAPPFKIKVVEPIKPTTRTERERYVAEAGYNLFLLRSEHVFIDLLTDSGTTAMSADQWAGLMLGDESYAGSVNFHHLQKAVDEVMGLPLVIPTHQGRGAENALFSVLIKPGNFIPGNMHFDTTTAHILLKGGKPVNFLTAAAKDPGDQAPFKGDADIPALAGFLDEHRGNVPFILITVTCNSAGGQPVSLANLAQVRELADRHGIPLFLDAARFAENAYFIKEREPGYQDQTVPEIVRKMFALADGCTMSAKKDALVNIGGFVALRDQRLYDQVVPVAVCFEGFPTYGGLAGRDMEAMARGLHEVLDEAYLAERIGQVHYLGEMLIEAGVPVIQPLGGHAVYLDATGFLPHIPAGGFPGQSLSVALYLAGGVRTVEIGTVLAGRDPETGDNVHPDLEMVRLAIPRRVYTDRHMDAVAEAVIETYQRRESLGGYTFTYEPPILRHFTARFAPL